MLNKCTSIRQSDSKEVGGVAQAKIVWTRKVKKLENCYFKVFTSKTFMSNVSFWRSTLIIMAISQTSQGMTGL